MTIGFLSSLNLGFTYNVASETYTVQDPKTAYELTQSGEGGFGSQMGDFFRAIQLFMNALAQATILLPAMLMSLGVPSGLAAILGVAVNFLYIVGLIQFIRGMNIE